MVLDLCLTPGQAHTAASAYTGLSPDEEVRLHALIEGFVAAQQKGLAVAQVAGTFVDPPVYLRAVSAVQRHSAYVTLRSDSKGAH